MTQLTARRRAGAQPCRRSVSVRPLVQIEDASAGQCAHAAQGHALTGRGTVAASAAARGKAALHLQQQRRAHTAYAAAAAPALASQDCSAAPRSTTAATGAIPARTPFSTISGPGAGAACTLVRQPSATQASARHIHTATVRHAAPATAPPQDKDGWALEYEGTVSTSIRTLKMVSITTAGMALLGCPPYLYLTLDGTYTAVKIMSAVGFSSFGLFTTGAHLTHGVLNPFVVALCAGVASAPETEQRPIRFADLRGRAPEGLR